MIDLMSSKESDDEGNDIVLRPLGWRVEEINFFQELDSRHLSRATDSKKRQTAKRRTGDNSLRDTSKVPRRLTWTVGSTVYHSITCNYLI